MTAGYQVQRVGGGPRPFSAFMDENKLEVVVQERPLGLVRQLRLNRYYVTSPGVEISEPGVLIGVAGNGETPEAAVQDFANRIAGELLVVDAYKPERREIQCPNEWSGP